MGRESQGVRTGHRDARGFFPGGVSCVGVIVGGRFVLFLLLFDGAGEAGDAAGIVAGASVAAWRFVLGSGVASVEEVFIEEPRGEQGDDDESRGEDLHG